MAIILIPAIRQSRAQGWTLKQCIDHALENNISIKQSELNVRSAEENLLQSKAGTLPILNANLSHSYNFGRTIDPFTNQFATERVLSNSFSISSNVTLFNGLQTLNNIKLKQLEFEISKYETDEFRNDISLTIAGRFLQILFNEELFLIAKNQVEVIRQQRERTKKLVDAGSLARGSLLDIEAQVALDELQLVNARNQLDLSYLDLILLLDLDTASEFEIIRPEIENPDAFPLDGTPAQIFNAALGILPQVKSAEYRVEGSLRGLSIAKGAISPRLTLAGSYGTGYSDARKNLVDFIETGFDTIGATTDMIPVITPSYDFRYETTSFIDQLTDNLNYAVGLNLSIPIFNGLQTKTSISKAKISLKNAEYELELLKDQLYNDIQIAYADAKAALKKHEATKISVAALQVAFDYTGQKFDAGMVTSVEYNDAKNKLVKAKSDLLQAKYDYLFKIKVLDFYQGRSLAF